jgi:proton-translocating NADH-quinone oxidoreductase chain L
MSEDPHRPRFISYLSLFTFFILILVTADNFVQMFVGWEGVGLCSYLLINFWFTRIQANKAAIQAILVNRIGDLGLALGMVAIFAAFGTLEYESVFNAAIHWVNESTVGEGRSLFTGTFGITVITLLLFVGAVGKSAQLGLHTWLPSAMEGPTPVSALIHAATMVTAGVFLIARCSPLFELSEVSLTVVGFIGAATAFFAATVGLVQNDIKKVIAYSTCSQLGYMVMAAGMSAYAFSVFHLGTHAFFKALLFLSAGSVIHAVYDEQDMRKIGGLAKVLPITYAMIFIGSISLIGFPFISGFYSKDGILEACAGAWTVTGNITFLLGTLGASFTAFYSIRLLYLVFLAEYSGERRNMETAHESGIVMLIPLLILAFGAIFVGYIMRETIISLGTDFWSTAIFVLPVHEAAINAEFNVPLIIKLLPLIFSLGGAGLAFNIYGGFGPSVEK